MKMGNIQHTQQVTMCKSNSGFSGNFSGTASFKPRQIFDLTNFQRLKIWLIGSNELKPLVIRYYSCTQPLAFIRKNRKN